MNGIRQRSVATFRPDYDFDLQCRSRFDWPPRRAPILISFAADMLTFARHGAWDQLPPMSSAVRPWTRADSWFGNAAVVVFMLVQYLDGFYTYAGFSIFGIGIEANPLIRGAVMLVGPGVGLASAKLVAIGFGMLLHLRGVHGAVVVLTAIYLILSIIPWTTLLFLS
jgi:hypothetical protein